MKVERDNPEPTTLESELAPGTVYYFPADPKTWYMRTDSDVDGGEACVVLGDPNDYCAGHLYAVDAVPVVVVDATLRVRG